MGSLFRERNELVHLRYFLTVLARGKRDELWLIAIVPLQVILVRLLITAPLSPTRRVDM